MFKILRFYIKKGVVKRDYFRTSKVDAVKIPCNSLRSLQFPAIALRSLHRAIELLFSNLGPFQGLLPDYFFLTGRYRVYFHGYDTSSDKYRVFSTAA